MARSALSLSVLSSAFKPVIALSARSRSVASSASTFSTSAFSVEGPALRADHRQDIRDFHGALASVPQLPRWSLFPQLQTPCGGRRLL
jgi:hypothetical protein